MLRPMKTLSAVRAFRARPMIAVAALFTMAVLGNAVLVGCGSKAETPSTQETPPPPTTETPTPPPGGEVAAAGDAQGAAIYAQRCVLCHGAGGKGDGPASASLNPKPRNHTDGSYMNAQTDAQLLEVLHNGKGAMPGWKSVLSEDEINAVLKHVRSLAVPPYQG